MNSKNNLDTIHRKYPASVWAALLLISYSIRVKFTTRTENHVLRWTLNLWDETGKLERWRLRLTKFCFEVIQRESVRQQAYEVLRQLPASSTVDWEIDDESPVLTIQLHTHNKELKSTCHFQDFENQLGIFESRQIMNAKAEDVELPPEADLIQKQAKRLLRPIEALWWNIKLSFHFWQEQNSSKTVSSWQTNKRTERLALHLAVSYLWHQSTMVG